MIPDVFLETTLECIGVKTLRKKYGADMNLEKWVENPRNVYIGRYSAWVKGAKTSPYANPFKTKQYGLEKCIKKYRRHIIKKVEEGKLDLEEDLGGKNLGCWCLKPVGWVEGDGPWCHGVILLELLEKQRFG